MVRAHMTTAAGIVLIGLATKGQLASAVTTTNGMARALATSTSSSACAAEVQLCGADTSCSTCSSGYEAAFDTCTAGMTTTSGYVLTETCDESGDLICCAAAGCEDNTAFADLIGAYCKA